MEERFALHIVINNDFDDAATCEATFQKEHMVSATEENSERDEENNYLCGMISFY